MILAVLRSRTTWVGLAIMVATGVHLAILGPTSLTPTVSLVEAEWTACALVGVAYSWVFLHDVGADWHVYRAGGDVDAGDRLTVEILLLIGWVMIGLHLLLVVLGVVAATAPATAGSASQYARALGVSFTVAGEALVGALVVIRRKRAELRSL